MSEQPTLRGTWRLAREAAALGMSGHPKRGPQWAQTAVAVVSVLVAPRWDWATKPELLRRVLFGTPVPQRCRRPGCDGRRVDDVPPPARCELHRTTS